MTAAYVGALAPSGRIQRGGGGSKPPTSCRRVQRIWSMACPAPAASVSQLDALGRELWQQHTAFQPLRRLIEELLVTSTGAGIDHKLNGVVEPIFDWLWFEHVAAGRTVTTTRFWRRPCGRWQKTDTGTRLGSSRCRSCLW